MSMAWGTRRCRLCGAGVLAVAHIPHVPTYATLQGVVRPIFGRHQPWRLRWGAGVRRAHPQVPARPFPRAGLGPPGGCIPPLPRGCMPTPPSARAHPPECPSWPQLPSPTLGPTPTRATPSVSFRSSKTRAPPRSKPPPPARRSSPARALPPSSSASSPATPRPRCCHIGLQPLHIGLQPLLHRVTASVTTPRPRRCSSKSV